MPEPLITVGISPNALQGVAIAAYSARYSRMWAWNACTLEVLGFQDIKARAMLRDVSSCGRYCAYCVEAHHKEEYYVAISRPPYFQALWLRNTHHLGYQAVLFHSVGAIEYCLSEKWIKYGFRQPPEERLVKDAPFTFIPIEWEAYREESELFAARCSGIVEYTEYRHGYASAFTLWAGTDPLGRRITVRESQVFANDVPFLDCHRLAFEAVATPAWAMNWEPTSL